MKIVIDIDEETGKYIQGIQEFDCGDNLVNEMFYAIHNGQVLPKGNGNLVDADKVILGLVYDKHIDKAKCGEITKIFDNAVVIPADKGE